MIELPAFFNDPKAPPHKGDQLAKGIDCARHPLLGCIIAQNGTSPEVQARNYLLSLRQATFHKASGRPGDLSVEKYQELLAALTEWEKTNSVSMPPQLTYRGF
jgi:hypothetical protein